MQPLAALSTLLRRIDGRSYRAYKDLRGSYAASDYELHVDHVQGDPFAAPSRLRVFVPHAAAAFDPSWWADATRRVALADLLVRNFARACRRVAQRRGSGKSGMIDIDAPSQQVLERTAGRVTEHGIELRFAVGLPASGRRVLGREANALLTEDVPEVVERSAFAECYQPRELAEHIESVEDQRALRAQLGDAGLVAFIGDGSLLPRKSGVDPRPMARDEAVPFETPDAFAVTLDTPNRGPVRGMGIPTGVTLIVGGGYHGKSTLLTAIELGIYDCIPGDGRELVVASEAVVKIRAEDGRRVEGVDISPFIDNLPGGRDTRSFRSEDASGSTSQAANVMEAIEAGARTLLIDEDTAATNFMIRDQRMQQLIAKEREPITPFVDKVRQLADDNGVSTIVVIGGSGDYFDVADRVIAMDAFRPQDVTERAKEIAATPTGRRAEGGTAFGEVRPRHPLGRSVDASKGRRERKIGVRDMSGIQFGAHHIDLSAVGQLVERSQLRAIGHALAHARRYMDGEATLPEVLDAIDRDLADRGLDAFSSATPPDFARFRRFDLATALNRLRTLEVS